MFVVCKAMYKNHPHIFSHIDITLACRSVTDICTVFLLAAFGRIISVTLSIFD